jgi:outer membrane protein assembly factor BamB
MFRPLLTALVLLVPLALAVSADDADPEPPRKGATAKSGDYTVTAHKNGDVVLTDKDRKVVWKVRLRNEAPKKTPQVGIGNERVVFAQEQTLTALDLKTGKTVWSYTGNLGTDATLTVKDNMVTLNGKSGSQMFDLRTGRMFGGFKDKRKPD